MELGKLVFQGELPDSWFVQHEVEVANNQSRTTISNFNLN